MITHIKTCLQMIKDKISKYWDFYLFFFIMIAFIVISIGSLIRYSWNRNKALYDHLMSIESNVNENTLTLPDDSHIYIVQPQGEQEVVIIGDPENIKVKPKKK